MMNAIWKFDGENGTKLFGRKMAKLTSPYHCQSKHSGQITRQGHRQSRAETAACR